MLVVVGGDVAADDVAADVVKVTRQRTSIFVVFFVSSLKRKMETVIKFSSVFSFLLQKEARVTR